MFKDKLKELRKEKGVTQEELANAIFVSREAVSKWEQGRGLPSDVNLEEISKYFNVSPDELISKNDLKEQVKISEKKNDIKTKFATIISLVCIALISVVIILSINLIKKENEILENRIVVGYVVVPKENSLLNKDKLYIEDPFSGLYEIPNCDNITINIDGVVLDNYELQDKDLVKITFGYDKNIYGFSQDAYPGVFLQPALSIECIAKDVNFEYLGNVYNVTIPLNNVDNSSRLPHSKLLNIKINEINIEAIIDSYNEKYITFSITIKDMRIFFPNFDKAYLYM